MKNKAPKIITESDSNGFGKQKITDIINTGYKISSTGTQVTNGGGWYTVYTLVRKNWLERLLKL